MSIEVIILGRAQDAGMPQAGCACPRCAAARAGQIPRELAASLAIVDQSIGQVWLIDAGPDFREQLFLLDELRPGTHLAGILITHAHIGHYVGLIHLGREAMNTAGMNVHGTPRLREFLRRNGPWSQLVSAGNIALREQQSGSTLTLSERLQIEFVPIPHRSEFSDTVALILHGPSRSLFYCTDIDSWEKWDRDVRTIPNDYDISIIDGTFMDGTELPCRDMSVIPHPTIRKSMELIGHGRDRVFFTHMNHTNPLISSDEARKELHAQGFDVVEQQQSFTL